MRNSVSYSVLAFCFLVAPSAYAETSGSDAIPENVIVSATRIATPVQQVASSVTVITADDIAASQERMLPDVLKTVPGLNLVQTGGPGGGTSVFMRGTNANHTKVYVDGIEVSDPSIANGAFDFSQLQTNDIERVEVLRGPQSGLYGSDAIGGVINIITKSGNGPTAFSAGLEGGSFATFNQMGGISGSSGNFHYAANLDHFHSGSTPVTPSNALAPGEKRIDDYDDNLSASTKLGLDISNAFDLGLAARYEDTHYHYTGDDFSTFPSVPAAVQSKQNETGYALRGTAHFLTFADSVDTTLGIAYNDSERHYIDPLNGNSSYGGNRTKSDWQSNVALGTGETLVVGAEAQSEGIDKPISASRTSEGVFGELQSAFNDSFFNSLALRYDDDGKYGGKATYRVAPAYVIADTGTKLKASYGTGFKSPTLDELFHSYPSFGFFANPNLKPETSSGYDAGIEQALGSRASSGLTYFNERISNLIAATFTTSVNVGKAQTDGVEAFLSYNPSDSWKLRADYTFTDANDQTTHSELLRRPKNKASLDARWQATDKLFFDATLLYVGRWKDFTRSGSAELFASSYTTLDVAAEYAVDQDWTVFGRITNVGDDDYQTPLGFLQPARAFYAGLRGKF